MDQSATNLLGRLADAVGDVFFWVDPADRRVAVVAGPVGEILTVPHDSLVGERLEVVFPEAAGLALGAVGSVGAGVAVALGGDPRRRAWLWVVAGVDGGEALVVLRPQSPEHAELERANRELAALVEHVPAAVVTWDLERRIVSWSSGAAALYGLPAADAIGRGIDEIVPLSERGPLREMEWQLLEGESVPAAQVFRLRQGYEIEVEEQLFLIADTAGEPVRFAGMARDRSELLRLQSVVEIVGGSHAQADTGEPARSVAMMLALETIDRVARHPTATVLLLGETGVGKSWLARRLHAKSPRAGRPFLELNCASLSPQLLESELFGHERGAFTSALTQKLGLVEAADGGTLFLDEVGELPHTVQAQLLTFLDSRAFRRVGGTRTFAADVRILAATNLDLEAAIEDGRFRRDLYYRLSVVPVRIPPLRERPEEIPDLARSILAGLVGHHSGRVAASLRRPVVEALRRYAWPGNVRELRNVLERALILSPRGEIELAHLPLEIRGARAHPEPSAVTRLDDAERQHIEQVLADAGGNRTRAAEVLGISRSTLKRKLAGWSGNAARSE